MTLFSDPKPHDLYLLFSTLLFYYDMIIQSFIEIAVITYELVIALFAKDDLWMTLPVLFLCLRFAVIEWLSWHITETTEKEEKKKNNVKIHFTDTKENIREKLSYYFWMTSFACLLIYAAVHGVFRVMDRQKERMMTIEEPCMKQHILHDYYILSLDEFFTAERDSNIGAFMHAVFKYKMKDTFSYTYFECTFACDYFYTESNNISIKNNN